MLLGPFAVPVPTATATTVTDANNAAIAVAAASAASAQEQRGTNFLFAALTEGNASAELVNMLICIQRAMVNAERWYLCYGAHAPPQLCPPLVLAILNGGKRSYELVACLLSRGAN